MKLVSVPGEKTLGVEIVMAMTHPGQAPVTLGNLGPSWGGGPIWLGVTGPSWGLSWGPSWDFQIGGEGGQWGSQVGYALLPDSAREARWDPRKP
eukprot:933519-Pelagomonas_calceolata.AAC.2